MVAITWKNFVMIGIAVLKLQVFEFFVVFAKLHRNRATYLQLSNDVLLIFKMATGAVQYYFRFRIG